MAVNKEKHFEHVSMEDFEIKLNHYELGMVMGSLGDNLEKLPPRLKWQLKLHMARAYLGHKVFGKQAEEDIKLYTKRLEETGKI